MRAGASRATDSIIELFEAFPNQEFDAKSILAQVYASRDTVYRRLDGLVEAGILAYRHVETQKSVKRVYRRANKNS
jgi:Fe2+ or Zn2+ uptake regulation protein